jgi:hypothetical protein
MNSSNLSTTIWLIKLSSKWQPRFTLLGAILIVVQTVVLRIWTLVSVTSKRCCRHSVFNSVPMLLLNLRSRDFLVNLHRHHLQLSLARGPTQYHRLALLLAQVNVFLTGVTPDVNMTGEELRIFDDLMNDLLVPRLSTVQ